MTDVKYGASQGDDFDVEITTTINGAEYRHLLNPYPTRYFNVSIIKLTDEFRVKVLDLYWRVFGRFAGFRVRALDDFSTNVATDPPTAFDQDLVTVTAGSIYQLVKRYGVGTPLSIGRPVRTIFKPVSGTVKVGIGALEILNAPVVNWSVDTTTGKVTFAANKARSITGITKAASAVVTVGTHTFLVGESVYFSGVAGMTQINGLRGAITAIGATTITVAINSTAFSTWSSGGTVNTQPQSGETVKGGCEFDIPCRFNSRVQSEYVNNSSRAANDIELKELLTL